MQVRILALVIAVGAIVALNGCGDSTGIQAIQENVDTTRTVYALNGTANSLPAGLNVYFATPVRIDASFAFDLAFDIVSATEATVYTQRKVASQLVFGHRVGLQRGTGTFAEATVAPTSGYVYDSLLTLSVGQLAYVDVIDTQNCSQYSLLGQNIRAKLVIESIDPGTRALSVHLLANRSCGFKSLLPGLPKD